jgi:PHD/YefM family antitoxin component YafN of YafNO toxin-antitoxin module
MKDQLLDILALDESLRRLVSETEILGRRTVFSRNGKRAAVLISFDEYLALKETIDVATGEAIRQRLEIAEEQVRRGQLLSVEDLLVE